MAASPRLPAGVVRPAAYAEAEATEAELNRMAELALRRGAQIIAIGSGRSAVATGAVAAFARRWEAGGRIVLDVVTWPEEAASWLRQARRFTAADPDLWVMAGPPGGWAQMTRRLLWSTSWEPGRTIAFASLGSEHAIGLVGAGHLTGLAGATADGRSWTVRDGQLQVAAQGSGDDVTTAALCPFQRRHHLIAQTTCGMSNRPASAATGDPPLPLRPCAAM